MKLSTIAYSKSVTDLQMGCYRGRVIRYHPLTETELGVGTILYAYPLMKTLVKIRDYHHHHHHHHHHQYMAFHG